jgi:hypothetical protein
MVTCITFPACVLGDILCSQVLTQNETENIGLKPKPIDINQLKTLSKENYSVYDQFDSTNKFRQALNNLSTVEDVIPFWRSLLVTLRRDSLKPMSIIVKEDFIKHLVILRSSLHNTEIQILIEIINEIASIDRYTKKLVEPALFLLSPDTSRIRSKKTKMPQEKIH